MCFPFLNYSYTKPHDYIQLTATTAKFKAKNTLKARKKFKRKDNMYIHLNKALLEVQNKK